MSGSGQPRVPPEAVPRIRRLRWLFPLAFEAGSLILLFILWHTGARAAWWAAGAGAAVAVVPAGRAQYALHRDGLDILSRLRTLRRSRGDHLSWTLLALAALYRFLPPVPRAAVLGVAFGVLQGTVIGMEVALTRLLRAAR